MLTTLEKFRKKYNFHKKEVENLYEKVKRVKCGNFENCYLKLNLWRNIEYHLEMEESYLITIGRELKGLLSEECESKLFDEIRKLREIHNLAQLELEECEKCFFEKFAQVYKG